MIVGEKGGLGMGFFTDDLKKRTQEIEAEAHVYEERRTARRTLFLWSALILILLGGAFAYIQLTATEEKNLLPKSREARLLLVNQWKSEGLIKKFDVQASLCLVDEEKWTAFPVEKRSDIAITLGAYCMDINKAPQPKIIIKTFGTNQTLVRLNETEEAVEPPVQPADQESY